MGLDISELISQAMTGLGENTIKLSGIEEEKKQLQNQSIAEMQAAGPAAISASQQKLLGEYNAQESSISVRNELGNIAQDPNSLLGLMVQDFRENSLAARDQQQAIAAKQQVGLFDDPLQYVMNYVTLPDEINALKATQGKADVAAQTIQNMQALTTASAQAQKATQQSLTKQSMADAAVVQQAELNAKLNALRIDSLSYDSNAIKLRNENNAQVVQWGMQQHSMALQDAAAARSSEMHQAQMRKLKEAELDDQQYVQMINIGAKSQELPAMNLDTIKLMMKSPAQKQKLDRLLEQGFSVLSTGSNAVGATPGEAIVNTLEVNGLQGQQNRPTRDFLAKLSREAFDDYQTKHGKVTKMTPEVRSGIAALIDDKLQGPLNQKTGQRMEKQGLAYKMYENVESPGNLLKAADLPQLAAIPSVRNNPLYSIVIAPAVAAGVTSSSPETIYGLAVAARTKGLINDKQLALGISDLYKSAGADAYASRGMGKFGLPFRPSYIADATSVFSFDPSSKDRIDWARPESVLAYHTAAQSRLAYSSNYRKLMTGSAADKSDSLLNQIPPMGLGISRPAIYSKQ